MRSSRIYVLVLFLNFVLFSSSSQAQLYTKSTNNDSFLFNQKSFVVGNPPIAVNDTFVLLTGCENYSITGNILLNDYDPDGDEIKLYYIITPKVGELSITNKGEFTFTIPTAYYGTLIFEYYITEVNNNSYKDVAEVVIFVEPDHDCDNISDEDDIDDDNDGILDVDEGNGKVDSDFDGIPNSFDIDSDNDGITDNEEWQRESYFVQPSLKDINFNGWDDAYDNSYLIGGNYYKAVDSDNDGEPDFTDSDSDEDGISDYIEGCDINNDNLPDILFLYFDSDNDGLDDAFDVVSCWTEECNSIGSNSPLPDFNKSGIRDWRDAQNSVPGDDNFLTVDQIMIYPNPSKGVFSIYIPNSNEQEQCKLFLFSLSGMLVEERIITSLENSINFKNLNSGVYILKLQSATLTHSKQIIINR